MEWDCGALMATYAAEILTPPPTIEATKDVRAAEIMNQTAQTIAPQIVQPGLRIIRK